MFGYLWAVLGAYLFIKQVEQMALPSQLPQNDTKERAEDLGYEFTLDRGHLNRFADLAEAKNVKYRIPPDNFVQSYSSVGTDTLYGKPYYWDTRTNANFGKQRVRFDATDQYQGTNIYLS